MQPLLGIVPIFAVSVSNGGNWVLAGLSDGTVRLWDLTNKDAITSQLLLGHAKPVESVFLTEDGNWGVTGSENGTVRLWNLANKDAITSRLLLGHRELVESVACTADGNWVLTVSSASMRLWEIHPARRLLLEEVIGTICVSEERKRLSRMEVGIFSRMQNASRNLLKSLTNILTTD